MVSLPDDIIKLENVYYTNGMFHIKSTYTNVEEYLT